MCLCVCWLVLCPGRSITRTKDDLSICKNRDVWVFLVCFCFIRVEVVGHVLHREKVKIVKRQHEAADHCFLIDEVTIFGAFVESARRKCVHRFTHRVKLHPRHSDAYNRSQPRTSLSSLGQYHFFEQPIISKLTTRLFYHPHNHSFDAHSSGTISRWRYRC